MERIIIIDDKKCEKELAEFVEANKEHIRFNTPMNQPGFSAKGLIDALSEKLGGDDKIAITADEKIEIIHTRDITYLESEGLITRIFFLNQTYIETPTPLNIFAKRLRGSNFLWIHKNYIVNFDFFSSMNLSGAMQLSLANGTSLPVGEEKKSLLMAYLKKMEV